MWNEARANDQSRKGASLSGGAQSPCRQDAVSSLRAALDAIAHSWPLVKRREAFHPTPAWTTSGLALGMGTILAQTVRGQEERVLALLSVAFDKAWPPSILDALTRAQGAWREGKIANPPCISRLRIFRAWSANQAGIASTSQRAFSIGLSSRRSI